MSLDRDVIANHYNINEQDISCRSCTQFDPKEKLCKAWRMILSKEQEDLFCSFYHPTLEVIVGELNKLEFWLKENDIPYERTDKEGQFAPHSLHYGQDIHQICVPCNDVNQREWDAICHSGSYGYKEGLLEIMGSIVRDNAKDPNAVEGYLTAQDVIERIKQQRNGE